MRKAIGINAELDPAKANSVRKQTALRLDWPAKVTAVLYADKIEIVNPAIVMLGAFAQLAEGGEDQFLTLLFRSTMRH